MSIRSHFGVPWCCVQQAEELEKHKDVMDNHSSHIQALIKSEKDSRLARDRAKRSKMSAQSKLKPLEDDMKVSYLLYPRHVC